ncbi:MAG TPA: glycosyltransferase family 39 protein [Myxococcota bacterium]|nr:glycosyltransferase family 39 protein [Myxococcota bacterium]
MAAARGDLWLDELWSLQLARDARSALDVFWGIHHDNNDYLNTLWMMLGGDGAPPLFQRALSVASGIGLVALGAIAPLHRGRLEAAITALLLAGSRFLVHYGSEARGYGPGMFCALAAFVVLDRFFATRERRWAAAFAVVGALGILSHLTFVFVLTGAGVWVAVDWVLRKRASPIALALFAFPVALLGFLWLVDVRFLTVGGAPRYEGAAVLPDLAAATLGLPEGPLRWLALAFAAAAGFELFELARARDLRAGFFAGCFLAPLSYLAVLQPEHVWPRHFAVLVPLFLVLAGAGLTRLAGLGRAGQAAALAALAWFAVGNAVQLGSLLRDGRGHYRAAVLLILENSPPGPVTVGSFNDFRNRMVLDDQARRLGVQSRIVYVPAAELRSRPPDWLLMHDFSLAPMRREYLDVGGHIYGLAEVFPYAGLSGWSWLVYHQLPGLPR